MTEVMLHLYTGFREHADGKPSLSVMIEPGQTVRQLLQPLGIPLEETRIIFCNNRIVDLDHALHGGETVGVFPAVGGG